MAKLTAFQRLNKVFFNNGVNVNNYTIHKKEDNDIIIKTKDKEEFDAAALQARQQHLLAKQWKKAQYDITNRSLASLNEVKLMYREADLMDLFPEIGTALDIVTEECTYINDKGSVINITSGSERIKSILQDLFVNRLSINIMLPMICRGMCKYGNDFLLLDIDGQNGILGWKELPVYEVERYENGMENPYASAYANLNTINPYANDSTKFVWVGTNEYIPYQDWQIAHFRLLYNSIFLPFGCLVGDTRIEMKNGYKEIQNVQEGDKLWTFNVNTQERELAEVTKTMYKGVKETFLVKTKHNFIEGTDDHKLLTYKNGDFKYKEISELKVGDLLIISNHVNNKGEEIVIDKSDLKPEEANLKKSIQWWAKKDLIPDVVDEEFAKFFGFMIGDGWITYNKDIYFAYGEYDMFNKNFADYLSKITGNKICYVKNNMNKEINRHYEYSQIKVTSKALAIVMKRMGFYGKFDEKRIPEWVYKASSKIRKAFLDGLIIADGTLRIDKYDCLSIYIEMANKKLIEDIKLLVQSLGYKSGYVGSRERISIDKAINTRHTTYVLTYYESFNKQEKKYDIINRLNNGFKTEKIISIEPKGKKAVYDISVSNDNKNFFANGIVTHNCSFLHKARRHFRLLSMMEDSMLVYRLERAVERRVFKINVGAIDEQDVPAYVQQIANEFKRTPIIDPMTGQIDLRKNILCNTEDFFIPVRDANDPNPIETLPAAQNLTAIDDIKFIQNKVFTALRVPKSFLNFEEAQGDGKNLSLLDVRFSKTVNRIQQALLMELNKIAIIHLILLGFTDELTNFNITMNNPSSQAEMLEIENMAKKITTAKDAITDSGNGIPLMSVTRAWKTILKWSDKEISDNLEELRLEKALAAELERTSQIIKKTGIFDPVDNVYGEAGAEYSDTPEEGEQNNDMGGGASGGGIVGGGDIDFGEETDASMPGEEEMENGQEDEMNMNDVSNEDAEVSTDNENLGESYMRKLLNETLQKQKKLSMDLEAKQSRYMNMLKKKIKEESELKENNNKNISLYNKNFLINENLNSIQKQLKDVFNKDNEKS